MQWRHPVRHPDRQRQQVGGVVSWDSNPLHTVGPKPTRRGRQRPRLCSQRDSNPCHRLERPVGCSVHYPMGAMSACYLGAPQVLRARICDWPQFHSAYPSGESAPRWASPPWVVKPVQTVEGTSQYGQLILLRPVTTGVTLPVYRGTKLPCVPLSPSLRFRELESPSGRVEF